MYHEISIFGFTNEPVTFWTSIDILAGAVVVFVQKWPKCQFQLP